MDLLPKVELEELMERTEGLCVSVFLLTHKAGAALRRMPTLLGEK